MFILANKPNFFVQNVHFLASHHNFQTYFGLALYLVFAFLLCSLLAGVAYFFSLSAAQDIEKKSEYECGFEPFDSATRLPFDVHFYLVGILFLIFDVEIALLFPWVLCLKIGGWYSYYLMVFFIVVLAIGFLYEWTLGALIWPTKNIRFKQNAIAVKQLSSKLLLFVLVTPDRLFTLFRNEEGYSVEQSFIKFLPEFTLATLILYIFVVVSIQLSKKRIKKNIVVETWFIALIGLCVVAILLIIDCANNEHLNTWDAYLTTSIYKSFLKLLVVITCAYVLYESRRYINKHKRHLLEYPLILIFTLFFMLLLIDSSNFISSFMSLVGFSLNLYTLILFDADSCTSREAGVKYYYLSTLSSGIILYGNFLLFFSLKTLHFHKLNQLLGEENRWSLATENLTQAGIFFIFFGIFFKLSAFPGHLWAADVYEGSPDPIAMFFMLPVKIVVLAFFFQVTAVAFEPAKELWQTLLLISSLTSITWGGFAAFVEKKTKRFLAYTSINQIGFLLLGISAGSLESYRACLLYLLLYAISNFGFIAIFLNTHTKQDRNLAYLTDFRGFGQNYWFYSWSMAISLFSMAGIPPLAGFFGKYYILLHVQEQQLFISVCLALFMSLISTYYYLRLIKIFWFEGRKKMIALKSHLSFFSQAVLFSSEAFLWVFLLLSAPIFIKLDTVVISLLLT